MEAWYCGLLPLFSGETLFYSQGTDSAASKQDVPVVNETAIQIRLDPIRNAENITKRKKRLYHGYPADCKDTIVNPVNEANGCYPDAAD